MNLRPSAAIVAAALAVLPLRAQAPRTPVFQNLNAAQQGAFDRIDPALGTAVTAARNDLAAASLDGAADPAALPAKAAALAGAELALALARADTLARLQVSSDKLSARQLTTVRNQAGRGRGELRSMRPSPPRPSQRWRSTGLRSQDSSLPGTPGSVTWAGGTPVPRRRSRLIRDRACCFGSAAPARPPRGHDPSDLPRFLCGR